MDGAAWEIETNVLSQVLVKVPDRMKNYDIHQKYNLF